MGDAKRQEVCKRLLVLARLLLSPTYQNILKREISLVVTIQIPIPYAVVEVLRRRKRLPVECLVRFYAVRLLPRG